MKLIYQPAEDSYLLQDLIPKYVKGKSVLDMGTGSGILAETILKNKAKSILACDINPKAIISLQIKNIPSIQSDLFSNIKGKFEIIIFNPPYLPLDIREPRDSQLATTGGKKGDEVIIKFLKEAPKYLETDGKILLLISSLTPKKIILETLRSIKFKYHKVAQKKIFFEILEVWEIKKEL